MSKWIAEFELEDGDKMPEHMDLEYHGVKLDFHCRPIGKTYEDGLNEAWEAARKVVEMGEYDRKNVVFVRLDDGEFPFKKYSASEAITRIKEYENRIEVGDEVHTICDDTPMVVVNIFNEDVTGEKRVVSVSISGIVSTRYVEELEKTGRNFPQIAEVLKQMQEGEA